MIYLNIALLLLAITFSPLNFAASEVIERRLESQLLKHTKLGINPERKLKIYLPDGYHTSNKRLPVVYFLHGTFWDNDRFFEDGKAVTILDTAIANGVIKPFIFVVPDYRTERVGSFYQNNPVTGRWLDYTVKEVVPFIDGHFRTLAKAESRAVVGDFWGGYGALKLAMLYPEVFLSTYALHPVATATGHIPLTRRIHWNTLLNAKTYDDLSIDDSSVFFMALLQAFSPNANEPPFYFEPLVKQHGDKFVPIADKVAQFQHDFLLINYVHKYVTHLEKLRGIKFDWGRYDENQDHVIANENFSRQLDAYGIEHEAESFRGGIFDQNWISNGRVYGDVLPFFARTLVFE